MTTLHMGQENNSSGRAPRFWGWPRSALGWIAAGGGAVFVAAAFILPSLQSDLSERTNGRLGGGQEIVATLVVVGLAASVVALMAVRRHERSILVWFAAVPAMLLTVFWVLFAAGELLIGHD
jgi:uncharacterized membrane protein YhaH (DUF805 family)